MAAARMGVGAGERGVESSLYREAEGRIDIEGGIEW